MHCRFCDSTETVKNGSNAVGTPKYLCKSCHRQFVAEPKKDRISEETKELIDKLLLERIPLAGIVRVTGVSAKWLQTYVNEKYENTPRQVEVKKNEKAPDDRM